MSKSSTAFVIDSRARELEAFTASVTSLGAQSFLVLRKAVDLPMDALNGTIDCPIIVLGTYRARSSAGHVSHLGGEHFSSVIWMGGAGFGFEKWNDGKELRVGDALRPFAMPVRGTLLPAGCKVEAMKTHGNSNPETAQAAYDGLKVIASATTRFILVEGQSDYTSAWSFTPPEGYNRFHQGTQFPDEHRADVFSRRNVLKTALRREARKYFEDYDKEVSREEIDRRVEERARRLSETESPSSCFSFFGISEEAGEFLGDDICRLANELVPSPEETTAEAEEASS